LGSPIDRPSLIEYNGRRHEAKDHKEAPLMFLVIDRWGDVVKKFETLEDAVLVMTTWYNIASSGVIENELTGTILTLEEAKQAIIDREAFLKF
jgi:hypothetical protein